MLLNCWQYVTDPEENKTRSVVANGRRAQATALLCACKISYTMCPRSHARKWSRLTWNELHLGIFWLLRACLQSPCIVKVLRISCVP